MSRRITQAEVAEKAQVSQAMVSYVINNQSIAISDQTRQRVLQAVSDLGYVPNITARRLRMNKTYTVACVIPDINNPFYPSFFRGVQDTVQQLGYDLIAYNTDGSSDREQKAIESMCQGRVDGVVGVFFGVRAPQFQPLLRRNISVVRLEAQSKKAGLLPIDNIYIDNRAAGFDATSVLIDAGHHRIGMLGSKEGPAYIREKGYRYAMAANDLTINPDWIQIGAYSEEGGLTAMQQLLSSDQLPTAIVAANDLMALGAISAIRKYGLSVPEDFSVIGFDNIPVAKLVHPSLSTIDQHQLTMGKRAAEMLVERITTNTHDPGRCLQMPYQLIKRDSVKTID